MDAWRRSGRLPSPKQEQTMMVLGERKVQHAEVTTISVNNLLSISDVIRMPDEGQYTRNILHYTGL